MAYGIKYIMQFTSDRGNEIRIEVLKKDYQGEIIYKSLGGAPSLSIEQGDGAIKGSSLAFAMQADVEGELQELYTTDNKKFKVLLYRNDVLYWQGYLVPELYSENYVDPPYDVEVIASDQLGILKNVTYNEEDVLTSLIEIIQKILAQTLLDIQCSIHMQLSTKQGLLLETSYISAAAFNGQSCYDALNSILQSCNCCIMQIANEWIILSVTDATVSYCKNGEVIEKAHCTIGQMGNADVCPEGSVTMVNAPAIRGVTVGYNHTLRSSMLKNANCVNRSEWSYTPGGVEERFPGEIDMGDVVCKCYFWLLKQKNLKEDSSLQLWQDIALEHDTDNAYNLSFRYMFMSEADLLLLSVVYATDSNKTLYLTSNGWKTGLDKTNVNSYIHVTGTNGNSTSVYSMSDASKYQEASISFMLPNEPGALRIGFINCTSDYSDPFFTRQILVTDVYLTVDGVTGKTATTLVEPSATSSQEEMTIVYGEPINSVNAQALDMTYLRYKDGTAVKTVYLSGQEYSSYYPAIVQDFSRYYGVKKMQLQGALMGANVLHPLYVDIFSEKVLRLVSGQYDLLHDIVSVSIEEVPVTFVEYDLVVYAQENNPNKNTTTNSGTPVVGGGGESLLGIQSDGDVFVKNNRAITGVEAKFAALALPITKPSSTTEKKTYVYASNPDRGAIDLEKIAKYIEDQEKIWVLDSANGVVRTQYNVVSTQEIISGRRASGASSDVTGGGGISQVTAQMIVDALGYVPYSSLNPAGYITSAALDGYAKTSDIPSLSGYATQAWVSNNYQPKGNYLTSVAWGDVSGKPTTLGGYGITDALSTSGGKITSTSDVPLALNRTQNGTNALVFQTNGTSKTYVGYTATYNLGSVLYNYASYASIGIKDDGTPHYSNVSGTSHTLIHSGNIGSQYVAGVYDYDEPTQKIIFRDSKGGFTSSPAFLAAWDDYTLTYVNTSYVNVGSATKATQDGNGNTIASTYLKLSGGTVSNSSEASPLTINSSAPSEVGLRMNYGGITKAWFGWWNNSNNKDYGTYMYNAPADKYMGITNTGVPHFQLQTILHEGNYSSYALPLSGGVLEANNRTILTLKDTNTASGRGPLIYYYSGNSGTNYAVTGLNNLHGALLENFYGGKLYSLQVGNDGYLKYNSHFTVTYLPSSAKRYTGIEIVNGADGGGEASIGFTQDTTNKAVVGAWGNALNLWTKDKNVCLSIPISTGNVLIGTTTDNGEKLQVNGNITATGEIISSRRATSSDARLKDNINRLIAEDCLAMVRNLQPSSWEWKEDGRHSLGFIAQDIEPLMPYAVTKIKDEVLGMRLNLQYDQFFALVVGAIQCLDIKVNNHEDEIESLKNEVAELRQKLSKYETVWQ